MATGQDVCGTSFNKAERKFGLNLTHRNKPYSKASTKMEVDHLEDVCRTSSQKAETQPKSSSTIQKNKQYPPMPTPEMPAIDQATSNVFTPNVTNRFRLGNYPYTQVVVGLKGMQPNILLTRNGEIFPITQEELEAIEPSKEKSILSSEQADGGFLMCVFKVGENGNSHFERSLEPYSCPMDSSDNHQTNFQLSQYETKNLVLRLAQIKSAVESLNTAKPVFNTMYRLIVSNMHEIYNSMKPREDISDMFDDVLHLTKQCASPKFLVCQYLSDKKGPPTFFKLYEVLEVCIGQRQYLKQRFEMEILLDD